MLSDFASSASSNEPSNDLSWSQAELLFSDPPTSTSTLTASPELQAADSFSREFLPELNPLLLEPFVPAPPSLYFDAPSSTSDDYDFLDPFGTASQGIFDAEITSSSWNHLPMAMGQSTEQQMIESQGLFSPTLPQGSSTSQSVDAFWGGMLNSQSLGQGLHTPTGTSSTFLDQAFPSYAENNQVVGLYSLPNPTSALDVHEHRDVLDDSFDLSHIYSLPTSGPSSRELQVSLSRHSSIVSSLTLFDYRSPLSPFSESDSPGQEPQPQAQCDSSDSLARPLKTSICRWKMPNGSICNTPLDNSRASVSQHLHHVHYYISRKCKKSLVNCHWHGCNSDAMQNQTLPRHMKTHLGFLDGNCPKCGGVYTRESSLERHLPYCDGVRRRQTKHAPPRTAKEKVLGEGKGSRTARKRAMKLMEEYRMLWV